MAPNYESTRADGIATLLTGISGLLKSEKFTDLEVRLGDRVWNVHKSIVCARSEFFVKACNGEFREGKEGIVELHDDEPDVIDKMFHYMYNNEYDDADTETVPVLFNVRIVAAAEKYFVDHLALLAVSKLDYYVEDSWATRPFADGIEETYTTTADTDRQLRDAFLEVVDRHADELFDKDSTRYPHFQAMAAKTVSFSMEVAARLAKAEGIRRSRVTYRCPGANCPMVFRSTMKEADTSVVRKCGKCGLDSNYSWDKWQQFRTIFDGTVIETA
ncbi:hypothetical protein LTR56_019270 [Elasticomyces elasticus]|nr:hypothetical protein LTR22_023187 [Elasticomyces elasticus]KAK3627355.1 hypothetical protein LTR56_019270 [Elasticomyces elasticus]KAK4911431.1 hypothetical protein LTR49_020003 [Elasticomyces elasticus]KAK5755724.1 hypothetical protein LTS12_014186 [Elasticomyces elasticus]